jgi:hypothetical protein
VFLVELAVGDPHDAVALREQVAISSAVFLEGPRGLVGDRLSSSITRRASG